VLESLLWRQVRVHLRVVVVGPSVGGRWFRVQLEGRPLEQ
jgi:hypothetical protein